MEKENLKIPLASNNDGVDQERIINRTMTQEPVPQANLKYQPYTTIPSEKE